jgi:hypothetical protein
MDSFAIMPGLHEAMDGNGSSTCLYSGFLEDPFQLKRQSPIRNQKSRIQQQLHQTAIVSEKRRMQLLHIKIAAMGVHESMRFAG